jgi:hypothetical protein
MEKHTAITIEIEGIINEIVTSGVFLKLSDVKYIG